MLHNRRNNNIITNLHERYLRLIYNDENSSYEELLTKDGSVSIYHRNIKALATEFYKIKNRLLPEVITETLLVKQSAIIIYDGAMISEHHQFVLFATVVRVFLFRT